MVKFWQIFLRVLRSYSIEEKVVSIIVGVIVVVTLFQVATGFYKNPSLGTSESGIYTEGFINDRPTILNPLYVDFSDANGEISHLIFSGLTKYDPDVKSFVADLANLTVSQDKKTYTFTLKDKLFWHDGGPLTADDVYYTFHDIIQNPDFQNPILRANFEGVQIKEVDKKTVEFVLNRPNSFFITNLSVGILPKHILGQVAVIDLPSANFNLKPVGSGPYKVESAMDVLNDGRQKVTLTAFDKYYGEHSKIKNIRFNIYPDVESLLKEKNALNVVLKVTKDLFTNLEATKRFTFIDYQLPQYSAIFINMDAPVFKKYKVRLALLKAIDKTQLLKQFNHKTPVDTPLLELNQSDWIYKPNLDEAKGALFDSGYKIDKTSNDPYRKDAKGNVLKLVLLGRAYDEGSVNYEETSQLMDFLKKAWKEIGVQLDVQLVDSSTFNERVGKRDYDLVFTGQSLGYNLDTYSYWHSSQATSSGLNLSNYHSFAADSLIEKIRDTFDLEAKNMQLKELAKVIANDIPAIFLYRPSYTFATDGKVKGISLQNLAFPSDRFAHIEKWCIDCKEAH